MTIWGHFVVYLFGAIVFLGKENIIILENIIKIIWNKSMLNITFFTIFIDIMLLFSAKTFETFLINHTFNYELVIMIYLALFIRKQ